MSNNRAFESGWRCASLHDPSRRRGIWFRTPQPGVLELCAGREGDDYSALLEAGCALTPNDFQRVVSVLESGENFLREAVRVAGTGACVYEFKACLEGVVWLHGLFVATEVQVGAIIGKTVNFGGHLTKVEMAAVTDTKVTIELDDIRCVDGDPAFVSKFVELQLAYGPNPVACCGL